MAAEKKVTIKIIDATGIGYTKGQTYEVTEEEARNLIDKRKATPVKSTGKETAAADLTKVEKP